MSIAVNPLLSGSAVDRLQRMSRWMRAFIATGACGLMAATAWIWLSGSGLLEVRVRDLLGGAVPPAGLDLSGGTKLALFVLNVPSLTLYLFMLFQAWGLFVAYGRGQVFGAEAIGCLRRLARALIGTALLRPMTATLSVLLLTWNNPPGQRQLAIGISWEDYLCLLFGGLLIAIAWAMTEASRIEQDNAGFV